MTHQEALGKVMKLLRKGQDQNIDPNEAALFMAKAQEIMDRFQLDVSDIDFDKNSNEADAEDVKDFGYADPLDDVKYGNYRESWCVSLSSVVAFHNQCATRYRRTESKGSQIRIVGRPTDVETARYLYAFFKRQIEEMIVAKCKGQSSTYKGEFARGCITTLSHRLEEQRKATINNIKNEQAGNSMALIRVDNAVARIEKRRQDVDDFFKKPMYEILSERLGVSFDIAKALYNFDRISLLKICGGKDAADAIEERYKAYLDEQRKALKGMRLGRGPRGFSGAGSKSSTGGYGAGVEAGKSIRLTGSKGGIGRGSAGQIGGGM